MRKGISSYIVMAMTVVAASSCGSDGGSQPGSQSLGAMSQPSSPTPVYTSGPFQGMTYSIPGIIQAENYDEGGQGVGFSDLNDPMPATYGDGYRPDGVTITPTAEAMGNGQKVSYTIDGEWMNYTVNVSATGSYTFSVQAATPFSGTSVDFLVDGVDATGPISISNNNQAGTASPYEVFTSNVASAPVMLTQGAHVIQLKVSIPSGDGEVDLDYFTVN